MGTASEKIESGETIEGALKLLTEGKEFEKQQKFWNAIDKFLQGREVLDILANQQPATTEEDRQIAKLYREKKVEYWHHARGTLVKALEVELAMKSLDEDLPETLTDEEAALRTRVFCTLFSKPMQEIVTEKEAEQDTAEQQWSIEERLQQLNASLPSGFKTDDERMDSINKGLNKLGLSLYAQKKPFASFQETLPKSEDELVDEIMAQAKDELGFEREFGGNSTEGGAPSSKAQDENMQPLDDESSEEEQEDNSLENLKLSDEQLAIKHVRRRVVRSQLKLAQLVATLDEAHKMKDDDNLGDGASDDGEECLRSGKILLQGARRDLHKALTEWNEEFMS